MSRDPIGEEGGPALYSYASNEAVLAIDLLGMVDLSGVVPADSKDLPVFFRPSLPTGEAGMTLVNGFYALGQQQASVSNMISCSCSPSLLPLPVDGGSFALLVRCQVRIHLATMLEDQRGNRSLRVRYGIYGHEQVHAQNLLARIQSAMVPPLARLESGTYTFCPTEMIASLVEQLTSDFQNYLREEAQHDHAPFRKRPDGTLIDKYFPPLPGTPDSILDQLDPGGLGRWRR